MQREIILNSKFSRFWVCFQVTSLRFTIIWTGMMKGLQNRITLLIYTRKHTEIFIYLGKVFDHPANYNIKRCFPSLFWNLRFFVLQIIALLSYWYLYLVLFAQKCEFFFPYGWGCKRLFGQKCKWNKISVFHY